MQDLATLLQITLWYSLWSPCRGTDIQFCSKIFTPLQKYIPYCKVWNLLCSSVNAVQKKRKKKKLIWFLKHNKAHCCKKASAVCSTSVVVLQKTAPLATMIKGSLTIAEHTRKGRRGAHLWVYSEALESLLLPTALSQYVFYLVQWHWLCFYSTSRTIIVSTGSSF